MFQLDSTDEILELSLSHKGFQIEKHINSPYLHITNGHLKHSFHIGYCPNRGLIYVDSDLYIIGTNGLPFDLQHCIVWYSETGWKQWNVGAGKHFLYVHENRLYFTDGTDFYTLDLSDFVKGRPKSSRRSEILYQRSEILYQRSKCKLVHDDFLWLETKGERIKVTKSVKKMEYIREKVDNYEDVFGILLVIYQVEKHIRMSRFAFGKNSYRLYKDVEAKWFKFDRFKSILSLDDGDFCWEIEQLKSNMVLYKTANGDFVLSNLDYGDYRGSCYSRFKLEYVKYMERKSRDLIVVFILCLKSRKFVIPNKYLLADILPSIFKRDVEKSKNDLCVEIWNVDQSFVYGLVWDRIWNIVKRVWYLKLLKFGI